jgi:bifunctional enzyme CysN/CysC
VLYGVDADLRGTLNDHREHLRRLAEVAHILLDAGMILIVTAIELTQQDLDILKMVASPGLIEIIWLGEEVSTDIACDLKIPAAGDFDSAADRITLALRKKGILMP